MARFLVVFDWNGTLLDDLKPVFGSVLEIFRRYDVALPTLEEYRAEITANFMQFYWAHGIPRSATGEEINKIRGEVLQAIDPKRVPLVRGTREVLQALTQAGLKLAIVSAGTEVVQTQLAQLGVANFFDLVTINVRDKEAALKKTLAHFSLESGGDGATYIDDTYDGLAAAKKVGLWTCGVTWGYADKEQIALAEPHFIAEHPGELTDAIQAAWSGSLKSAD